jgi:hypothetical protein
MLYTKQGKGSAAEPLLKRALTFYENGLGVDHPHVARCCSRMAECCRSMGQDAEARRLDARARAIEEKHGHKPEPK